MFETLAKHGDQNLCFHLIAQNSFPSYGYILGQGATTLWESFEEYYRDEQGKLMRKDGIPRLPSFNHHFWGGVLTWFYKYIGWIDVVASMTYSRNGKSVAVSWKRNDTMLQISITVDGFNCVFFDDGGAVPLDHGTATIYKSISL